MTAGSRGDAAPYTGLGHRLVLAGHEVTLVTHGRFAPLVAGSGVRFHALPVDPRAELESPRGRGLHRSASGPGKLLRVVDLARRLVGRLTEDLLGAARESDVLLLSSSLAPLGHTIAEGLRLPSLGVYLQPLAATREFAPPVLGGGSWGGRSTCSPGTGSAWPWSTCSPARCRPCGSGSACPRCGPVPRGGPGSGGSGRCTTA